MIETETYTLNLDCADLKEYSFDLYNKVINYPQEVLPIIDAVVQDLLQKHIGTDDDIDVTVRTYNLSDIKPMRSLDPHDIDKLITLKGMIIRCSPIIPTLQVAYYECMNCKSGLEMQIMRGNIKVSQCSITYILGAIYM